MNSTKLLSYLKKEATANNVTIPTGFSEFFPNFPISNASAEMKGADLVIKGQLTPNSGELPFSLDQIGLSVLDDLIPSLPSSVSFEVKLIPSDGSKDDHNKVQLSIPIGTFSIPVPPLPSPQITGTAIVITAIDTTPWTASFAAKGTLPVSLYQNQTVDMAANASFTVSNDELSAAQVGLDDTFSNGVKLPSIFGTNIMLDNIGASMGISFDPPGCLVGVEAGGTIATNGKMLNIKSFAVVCDIEGDVPVPLYLGFNIDGGVDLADFVGVVEDAFPLTGVPGIIFSNPSFSYCSKAVTLPNGTPAPIGFSASSDLSFFGQNMFGAFTYTEDEKISADFQGNGPIGIGSFATVSGAGAAAIRRNVYNYSVPTTKQGWAVIKAPASNQICASNGPVFNLSIDKGANPLFSFDVNAQLNLLNEAAIAEKTHTINKTLCLHSFKLYLIPN